MTSNGPLTSSSTTTLYPRHCSVINTPVDQCLDNEKVHGKVHAAMRGVMRVAMGRVVGGGVLQWHVDGAFYAKNPPAVTALECREAPTTVPKAHTFEDAQPLQYRAVRLDRRTFPLPVPFISSH